MAPLDFEMAAILHEHIFNKGINISLQSCGEVQADLTILAIGINKKLPKLIVGSFLDFLIVI